MNGAFVAPYLTLMKEDVPQRKHPLPGVFQGLPWIVRTGAPWRMMPNTGSSLCYGARPQCR